MSSETSSISSPLPLITKETPMEEVRTINIIHSDNDDGWSETDDTVDESYATTASYSYTYTYSSSTSSHSNSNTRSNSNSNTQTASDDEEDIQTETGSETDTDTALDSAPGLFTFTTASVLSIGMFATLTYMLINPPPNIIAQLY